MSTLNRVRSYTVRHTPKPKSWSLLIAALLGAAPAGYAGTTISVDFQGRSGDGTNPPVAVMVATDVAGVVPVGNWNSLDDSYGSNLAAFPKQFTGTSQPLLDSTGKVTPVTVTFIADDAWNNDVDLKTNVTANAKMMKGVIKMGNGKTNEVADFTFNNVPDGLYDLYIYTDSNNENVAIDTTDHGLTETFHTLSPHQFYDSTTFLQATNMNPAGPRDNGNYVKFTNLTPIDSSIGFTMKYVSGGDGLGIAGMQLVQTATGAISDGLLAYWNFDGQLYDSVNDNHGSPRGATPLAYIDSQEGFGKALQLDGTNWVEITGGPLNALDSPNGSLSIAGWFKVDKFDKDWQALIAKGENSNYRVARRGSENTIAYAGGTGEGADDTPNINDAKWHHFAAITDATAKDFGTALYIDGVRKSVITNKPALTASTKRLLIGENPDATGRQWKGAVDDLGIWNRVLTADEVTTLYNSGKGTPLGTLPGIGSPIATILDFPFDEGQGTVVKDTVGGLTGIFGQAVDAAHAPVLSTDSPAAKTNDFAVSFNLDNATNSAALVVDDRVARPELRHQPGIHDRDLDQHRYQRYPHLRRTGGVWPNRSLERGIQTGPEQPGTPLHSLRRRGYPQRDQAGQR